MRPIALVLLALGCSRPSVETETVTTTTAPASASAAPIVTKAPVAATALPFCGADAGAEPLAVLCDIGKEAMRAHYECKDPELLSLCTNIDTWGCRTMAFAGINPPPVTFEARIDHAGPPIQMNVAMDMKKLVADSPRRGPLRGVAVHIHVDTDAEGTARLAKINASIISWGCADEGMHVLARHYSCGTWSIDTHYLDINKIIYVEAGTPGAFDCKQP